MASITELLAPIPITKHSIVIRDHLMDTTAGTTTVPYTSVEHMHQSTTSPVDGSHHDPSGSSPPDMSGDVEDGRRGYGKRELSTSKRAAQNRAAQRAFRQRKEGYIKKLEEQVRDYQLLTENYKQVQQENFQLRDYIINLQSRLLESQGEVPPPPNNLEGLQPGHSKNPSVQSATLPRLSELGAVTPPHMSMHDHKPHMTAAQAALQGASILRHSPPSR